MTELALVRTWSDGNTGAESDFPDFERLDEYDRALLQCIAAEG